MLSVFSNLCVARQGQGTYVEYQWEQGKRTSDRSGKNKKRKDIFDSDPKSGPELLIGL